MKKLLGIQDRLFPWALYPNNLYEYGLELGIPSEKLLANTSLTEETLSEVELKISWLQYKELAVNIGENGPADYGFQFGKRLHVASHGLLSLLLLNCANGYEVIELIEDYPVLVSPLFYVIRTESVDHTTLTIHPESTRHPILMRSMEALMTSMFQSLLQLNGAAEANVESGIEIFLKEERPAYHQEMSDFFHGKVNWGCYANQMVVSNELLSKTIPNANPISADSTRRMMQAQLNLLPARKGVLNELRELFAQGEFRQEDCAKKLLTTLPTLKRYLSSASTSFSKELTLFRIEEACLAAINSDISIAQLSEQLGFKDVNSFGRLFKKEMGVPFNSYCSLKRSS